MASDGSRPAASTESLRSISRRILTNSGWLLGARGINAPLAFLESLLVARVLGVELFGTLAIVITVVTVINRLASFRMNEFVVKYMSDALAEDRRDLAAATLKVALTVEAVTSLIAFGAALGLARISARSFVGTEEATVAISLYALVILSDAVIESTTGALQVFNSYSIQAATQVLRRIVTLAGVGIALFSEAPLLGIVLAHVAAHLATTLTQLVKVYGLASAQLGGGWWRTPAGILRPSWPAMRSFAISTNLSSTLSLVVKESDLLWLAYFRTPLEAGYYKLASTLLKIPFSATSPLTQSVYPELTRAVASSAWHKLRRIQLRGTLLAASWVLPVALGLVVLGPWIVEKFYGAPFAPAVPAMYALLVGLGLANLLFWTKPTMLALGKPHIALRITAVSSVLKVLLVLALVPAGGYLALAGILSFNYVFGITCTLLVIRWTLRELE